MDIKAEMIRKSPIKVGTLVKYKSVEDLLALNQGNIIRFMRCTAKRYADRFALITQVICPQGTYLSFEMYFPDDDSTHAWSYEDEFNVVDDLLEMYRGGAVV